MRLVFRITAFFWMKKLIFFSEYSGERKIIKMNQLPEQEVMQRWWKFMGDIMKTNSDGSPWVQPLKQVFYID